MQSRCGSVFCYDILHRPVSQENQRRLPFRRIVQMNDASSILVEIDLVDHRADPGMGVLQVRTCVALECDHSIYVEDVVAYEVVAQVGILHGTDADVSTDHRDRFVIEPMGG